MMPKVLYRIALQPNLQRFIPTEAQISRSSFDKDICVCACPEWWMCVNLLPEKYFQKGAKLYLYKISNTDGFIQTDHLVLNLPSDSVVQEFRSNLPCKCEFLGELKPSEVEKVPLPYKSLVKKLNSFASLQNALAS